MEDSNIQNKKNMSINNHRKKGTSITFTADEINALAKYVAGGTLLFQTSHPVVARLKAALTRLGLPIPQGL